MTDDTSSTGSGAEHGPGPAPDPADAAGGQPFAATATAASPPPPPPQRLPLRRSRADRKVAGIAGGLGRHTGVDPLVFRIVFIGLAVAGGSGILLYGLGWLLIPDDDQYEGAGRARRRGTAGLVGAVLLTLVGLIAFAASFDDGGFSGVVALTAIGVAAYLVARSTGSPRLPWPAASVPTGGGPEPAPPGAYGQTPGTAYAGFTTQPLPATVGGPYVPPAAYPPPPPPPPPVPPVPRERSPLGRITASVALLVAGLLVTYDLATGGEVRAQVVLAAALLAVGAGLVVGGFYGRARWLVFVGLVLALATSIASIDSVPAGSGTGERTWAPRTVADVRSPYELGAGEARLDLSAIPLPAGRPLHVEANVGAGHLVVIAPDDVTLRVQASSGIGSIRLPDGPAREGLGTDVDWTDAGSGAAGTIELDLTVGIGELEVRRATS
jgi:phage shock protein PspC (stress-responsive transcriptional regulator)